MSGLIFLSIVLISVGGSVVKTILEYKINKELNNLIVSIIILPMIPVSWLGAGFLSYSPISSFYLPLVVTVFCILYLVYNIFKYNKSLSVKNKDQIKKTD